MTPRTQMFRRIAMATTLLAFVVVVFGAYVRLTDAGLGCPDWPGCYGQMLVPDAGEIDTTDPVFSERPLETGKAWREMAHRYLAGLLGVLIAVLAVLAWRNRDDNQQPVVLPLLLVVLVVFQALLGMWTVTLLLKPAVVTAHLIGGMTTLALVFWVAHTAGMHQRLSGTPALRRFAVLALLVVAAQIVLGGWTSANYASLACPDFPRCQNAWWPDSDFGEAFVLWRGIGIDYEGGVLEHPARVAVHFTHRLGALFTLLVVGTFAAGMLSQYRHRIRAAGANVAVLLLAQLGLGIAIVLYGVPLGIATAHNAIAVLLLLSVVNANRALRYEVG